MANRSAHIAVGVDIDGIKHVLGIWVQATKGAKFGAGICVNLANRGVRDVLIVCCDGLTSSAEGDHRNLALRHDPDVCVVHLIRSSMRFVAHQDRKLGRCSVETDLHRP